MDKEEKSTEVPKKWLRSDGSVVACTEKVKVLEENWEEIRSLLQESLDDAVLMGCSEERVKAEFIRLVNAISSQYRDALTEEKKGSLDT